MRKEEEERRRDGGVLLRECWCSGPDHQFFQWLGTSGQAGLSCVGWGGLGGFKAGRFGFVEMMWEPRGRFNGLARVAAQLQSQTPSSKMGFHLHCDMEVIG